jgi:hypothetical protein
MNKFKDINKNEVLDKITWTEKEVKDEIIDANLTKNRRKMAWISLFLLILIVLFTITMTIIKIEIPTNNVTVITSLSTVFGFIIFTYITANSVEKIKWK